MQDCPLALRQLYKVNLIGGYSYSLNGFVGNMHCIIFWWARTCSRAVGSVRATEGAPSKTKHLGLMERRWSWTGGGAAFVHAVLRAAADVGVCEYARQVRSELSALCAITAVGVTGFVVLNMVAGGICWLRG